MLAPLLELFNNKEVKEKMEETARIYFTSDDVTVNLIWSVLIFGLLGLLLKPLLGIPLLDNILGAMTGGSSPSYGSGLSGGYGAPDAGYGAPDAGYGAPDAGYGAPDAGYGAPDAGYDAPDAGYGAPGGGASAGYDAPSVGSGYDAPSVGSGYDAPSVGSGYDAPSSGYDSPDTGYAAPGGSAGSGFNAGSSGYSAPQSGYSRGRRSVTLTEEQKSVYSNLVDSLPSTSADSFLTQRLAVVESPAAHLPTVNLIN